MRKVTILIVLYILFFLGSCTTENHSRRVITMEEVLRHPGLAEQLIPEGDLKGKTHDDLLNQQRQQEIEAYERRQVDRMNEQILDAQSRFQDHFQQPAPPQAKQ